MTYAESILLIDVIRDEFWVEVLGEYRRCVVVEKRPHAKREGLDFDTTHSMCGREKPIRK